MAYAAWDYKRFKSPPPTLNDKIGDIFGPSSYTTGGVLLSVPGIRFLTGLLQLAHNTAADGYAFQWNDETQKLQYLSGVLGGSPTAFVYSESDIKGSSATNVAIASGSLPTNGALISSLADAANTTAYTIALQPDIGRTIGIGFKNTNVGASTGNAVDVVIVGTFKGAAQTDTVSFTALELTSTAQNEVAYKYGVKPFDTITSLTPSAAQPSGWQHAAGPSSKIGMPRPTANNAEADIIKLTKNAAGLSPTGLWSSNQTINFGTLADGDDISMEYFVAGAGEVANGTDLSTLRFTVLAKGYAA